MKKKVLSILLILTILFSVVPYAHAETIQPRYSHVYTIAAGIDLSGSSLWCFGEGDSMFNDTYTYLYVRALRRPENGGNWSPVTSWSTSAYGVDACFIDETITVSPGYDYRLYVNVQIKDETGYILESVGMYSDIVSYPSTTP